MAAVRRWLDAKPGAVPVLLSARKGSPPISAMYKVKGKIFAIVSLRENEFVILKCDPHLATVLRAQYEGVGHRSHLIAVSGSASTWIAMSPAARSSD